MGAQGVVPSFGRVFSLIRRGMIAMAATLGVLVAVVAITGLLMLRVIAMNYSSETVAHIEVPEVPKVTVTDAPPALPVPNVDSAPSGEKPLVEAGPEWLAKHHGQLNGKEYEIAVKSGLYVTIPECQRALEAAEKQAVRDYLDSYLGEGAADLVSLDARYVHDKLQKQQYTEKIDVSIGTMQQMHALLVFNDEARNDFQDRWRQALVTRRLWYVGGGAAAVLAAVASTFGYLVTGARVAEREAVPR